MRFNYQSAIRMMIYIASGVFGLSVVSFVNWLYTDEIWFLPPTIYAFFVSLFMFTEVPFRSLENPFRRRGDHA